MDVVVIGAGFAGTEHYLPTLKDTMDISVIGVVDPQESQREQASTLIPGIWTVETIQDIPDSAPRDAIAFVLTPDHYPVVVELAECGFKKLVVEKPLVSRDHEIEAIQKLIEAKGMHF